MYGAICGPTYLEVGQLVRECPTWAGGIAGARHTVGRGPHCRLAAEAMGIDWMTRTELSQAIPLVYTEHIGQQLITLLGGPE